MTIDWINILERAAWTFAEGFLVALPTLTGAGMDSAAWKSALVGAAMAGLSAVKTLLVEIIQAHNSKPPDVL